MARWGRLECAATLGLLAAAAVGAGAAGASETVTYRYDAKGRLILVSHAGTVNDNVVAAYTFDRADNRKTLKVTGAP